MSELLKLAERCEKASGPDRELFWQAYEAVFGKANAEIIDQFPGHKMPDTWERFRKLLDAGGFLDAAMTLVPEGYSYGAGTTFYERKGWAYCIEYGASGFKNIDAATPALALCAAALRARAAKP